ncbi:peroxidase-like [Homarus americanus]|uniref:peroxidase-like n=1 Tax=Homarus americanus TaxID=6706 RepID=UPI001C480CB7|nr:peroxidase-like [Homarus americanus]
MEPMLVLLFLVVCWCRGGLGLVVYTGITLDDASPHTETLLQRLDPSVTTSRGTFFVDTNTVHNIFINPYTTQPVNPQSAVPSAVQTLPVNLKTVQNLVIDPKTLQNLRATEGDATVIDYQRRSQSSSAAASTPDGIQPNQENDPNVSPYWTDPEGRRPSKAPPTTHDDLTPPLPTCREVPVACNSSARYRSISGRCNNLLYPHLGSPGQPMPRVLPPVYDAGLMRTRSAVGGLLPNPREVSLVVREAPTGPPTSHNLLFMQIGQFIDHDLALISIITGADSTPKKCEACSMWRDDPACAPIPIPQDDSHLQPQDLYSGQRRCLSFVRSGAVGGRDMQGLPTLDQTSVCTAFLDLSTVYGSDECRERDLRLYFGGMMVEVKPGNSRRGFPPTTDAHHFEDCRSDKNKCFLAGDDRNNEHLALMVIHTLFFREHNRLATHLSALNPHWGDETIFQEARRINIAQYQHIVYSEFLPVLLGQQKMADYRLTPEKSGYYQGYDARVNPGVLNEFATSAFRVGHTMVPNRLFLLDHNYFPLASVPLVHTFHNSSLALKPGMSDTVVRGLVGTRLEAVDLRFEGAILNQLFQGLHTAPQDLFARNIARGRDHGIGPYIKYRAACGGEAATSFDDLLRVMSQSAVAALRQAYAHVEDVDLFPGGLAENHVPGGLVGPTFACIIAYQFLNSRRGDRFWYENADAGLTPPQLHDVRTSSSLARLVCDNLDEDDARIPANVFFLPSKRENPLKLCDQLASLDLTLWEEEHYPLQVECAYRGQLHPPGRYVHVSPCLVCLCLSHGHMRCKPQLSGCQQPNQDEHCQLLC